MGQGYMESVRIRFSDHKILLVLTYCYYVFHQVMMFRVGYIGWLILLVFYAPDFLYRLYALVFYGVDLFDPFNRRFYIFFLLCTPVLIFFVLIFWFYRERAESEKRDVQSDKSLSHQLIVDELIFYRDHMVLRNKETGEQSGLFYGTELHVLKGKRLLRMYFKYSIKDTIKKQYIYVLRGYFTKDQFDLVYDWLVAHDAHYGRH